ncbi:hypothetical protein KY316_00170 [Candidatus Woesearchaeota archaeon]|nr:hypothetical protein [Candidatus Woesearchaeota archaeon]
MATIDELFDKMHVKGFDIGYKLIRHRHTRDFAQSVQKGNDMEQLLVEYLKSTIDIVEHEGLNVDQLKELIRQGVENSHGYSEAQKMAVGFLTTVAQMKKARTTGNPWLEVPDFTPYIGICAGKIDKLQAKFICDNNGNGAGYYAKSGCITILDKRAVQKW